MNTTANNVALWRIIYCYGIIAFTIWISEVTTLWFYPLVILIIGHQLFTLALLGHEGTHGLLHANRLINNFIARFFCHFLVGISFSFYSKKHLNHHRYLAESDDLDISLYQVSYNSFSDWILTIIRSAFSIKFYISIFTYINGANLFVTGKYPYKIKTDYGYFALYWILITYAVIHYQIVPLFFLYFVVPYLIFLPWTIIINSFQHSINSHKAGGRTYNILFKNSWLQEFLFPLNFNLHDIHHEYPSAPYCKLPSLLVKKSNSIYFIDYSKKVFNLQKSKTS